MSLDGKIALVTGAGSGIGRAAAIAFARAGAAVGLLSRSRDELEDALREVEGLGGRGAIHPADVSDPAEMEGAVRRLVDEFGRLDIVFANAGINGVWAPLDELTPEEWDRTLAINLRGTFLTVRAALPRLRERGGSIIVTSSVNGTRIFSNSGATAYACSKAAQVAFVKMTALELAPQGIRINVICPGAVETDIEESTEVRGAGEIGIPVELPRGKDPLGHGPATSEQVAQLVLFLASDAASHITGTEIWIDGGQSLIGPRG